MTHGVAISGGKRASDRPVPAPAVPRRDRVLETAIARERSRSCSSRRSSRPAAASSGPKRWRAGTRRTPEAIVRARRRGRARPSGCRALIQRKALRMAASWDGPLEDCVSINLLPQEWRARAIERWLLEEIAAAGIDPSAVTVEITESALLADRRRWPAGSRGCAPPACASPSTISAPAMPASLISPACRSTCSRSTAA